MQMKPISKSTMMTAPIVIACGLLTVASPWANAQDTSGRRCSNATLRGDYGLTIEGLLAVPGPGIPFRGVVLQRYDGNGHFTQVDHVVVNGAPPPVAWRPGSGSYAINPDCTGRATINVPSSGQPPVKLHFVVTRGGREIRQVVDGNAVIATGEKVDQSEW